MVGWLLTMAERGHKLTSSALKMKVSEICASRETPFWDGIPGGRWMQAWKWHHPKLSLHTPQALESAKAKGIYEENVQTFYNNLEILYKMHKYSLDHIWNCNESGALVGKNKGVL